MSAVALCSFVCLLFVLCRANHGLVPLAGVSLSQVAPHLLCGLLYAHEQGLTP